tara:strand:+ start:108 stop:416 length:309 start_codon:yes stop_codon:yes gene_type:complete
MIYEIVWNTDGENPSNMDLPKYVVISNNMLSNPNTNDEYPDPPVFHIIPNDYPALDVEAELANVMTDIFDWCISDIYMVNNSVFESDMKFFASNKFVNYEFK